MDSLWEGESLLTLDDLKNHKIIIETIFTGGLGSCLGKSLLDIYFTDLFKQPAGIGIGVDNQPEVKIKGSNILKADNIQDIERKKAPNFRGFEWREAPKFHPTSADPVVSAAEMHAETLRRLTQSARDSTYMYIMDNEQKVNQLKRWNSIQIGVCAPELYLPFGDILKLESQAITRVLQQRMIWMGNMDGAMNFLSADDSKEIQKIHYLLLDNINNYNSKLEELNDKLEKKGDVLLFFNEIFEETNAFRNQNTPIVNKAEKIFLSSFKTSIYSKSPIFKELINKDFIEGKQIFNKEEQCLKKKVSEALKNAKRPIVYK